MNTNYTARAYRNPNRQSFSISFRHPMKTEKGRQGRKVCKGLGTELAEEATRLESDLNELLKRTDLHSVLGRSEAAKLFDDRVIDIFFEDLDPMPTSHRGLRDRILPLPKSHAKTLLAGITGAGKSTVFKRLIGTNGTVDRFPSVSVNRTTTCSIEVITGFDDYSVAVTFLSRHQAQQEVIESLSAAVLKGIEGAVDHVIVAEFLEQSDQRFRLKYLLGGIFEEEESSNELIFFDATPGLEIQKTPTTNKFVLETVAKIQLIARDARGEIEAILGPLSTLAGDSRDYALDEMLQTAEQSDAFLDLANEVMDEITARFSNVEIGDFERSSAGWPKYWTISLANSQHKELMAALRMFSGISKNDWGTLLTPLVNGIRVQGSFRPSWVPQGEKYDHVFMDSEGLLHAKNTTEVPSELTSIFKDVDTIMLVESAENALHSPVAAKFFEAVASTGYTSKFALMFTHMDAVTGENLATVKAKQEHVFGGARNILDNEVARNLSRDVARQLLEQLATNTRYFGYLDEKYPTVDKAQIENFERQLGSSLWQLTTLLASKRCHEIVRNAVPKYSFESLGQKIREASLSFLEVWDARLGYKRLENVPKAPWQSVKAMSRRYAEGWLSDGYWLQPIDTLLSILRNSLTSFLDLPLEWEGEEPTVEEGTAVKNRLKQIVNESLTELCRTRLWRIPQPDWRKAYELWGPESTFTRRQVVRTIFQHHVPILQSSSDRWAQRWNDEVKKIVADAVDELRSEQHLPAQ